MFGYDKYIQGVNERAGCDASYVHSVLNPSHEDAAVRIPEPFGRPSTTCQLKMQVLAKSSLANGHLIAYWNPRAIFGTSAPVFTYASDNGTNLVNCQAYNASISFNSTTGRDWSTIASFHRLVSAECRIDYIGRLDESSGMLTCSLVPQSLLVANANLLDLTRDGYFYHGGKAQEGLRMVYLPMDNKDVEYTKTNAFYDPDVDTTLNSQYMIIGYGLPVDKFLFNVELTFNIEYIPSMTQVEYVPTGVSKSTLLEESLAKITQASRQDGLVINASQGLDVESAVGGVLGGLLGNLLGGEKGAAVGASVGTNFNPFASTKSYDQMVSDAQKPFGQRMSNWLDPFPGYGYKRA